jgi:hypothetical protein
MDNFKSAQRTYDNAVPDWYWEDEPEERDETDNRAWALTYSKGLWLGPAYDEISRIDQCQEAYNDEIKETGMEVYSKRNTALMLYETGVISLQELNRRV